MTSHSTVVPLRQPDGIDDPLTAVCEAVRAGFLPGRCKRKPRRSWR